MLCVPALRKSLRVRVVPDEGICLFYGADAKVLSDPRLCSVLELVDGRRTASDLAQLLSDRLSTAEVFHVLMHLEGKGYIVESRECDDYSLVDELAAASDDLRNVSHELKRWFIFVENLSATEGAEIRVADWLGDDGLTAGTRMPNNYHGKHIRIVLVDDFLDPALIRYFRSRSEDGEPWIILKISGAVGWVSPLFQAAKTPCYNCMASRIRQNRLVEMYASRKLGPAGQIAVTTFPSVERGTSSVLSSLLLTVHLQGGSLKNNALTQFDIRDTSISRHPVIALDGCSACGNTNHEYSPPSLTHRTKEDISDGGYRSVHPSETLILEDRLVSPITGIISHLFPLDGAPATMPVFLARHNFGYQPSSLLAGADNLANTSAGKGRSTVQAKASALAEAVERHSVFFQEHEPVLFGSMDTLGDEAIHPNRCMLFSDLQFAERNEWNRRAPWSLRVPEWLESGTQIEWSPIWSLTHGAVRLLPTSYLYHTHHLPATQHGRRYCFSDSNGNAAGNNLEEAVLQGFLEVVERDAVAVWWYNKLHRPRVALSSLDDPYVDALAARHQQLGRNLWLLDITHDFDIPVYVALSCLNSGIGEGTEILTGFGCHLDSKIAVSRALTELNQMLPRSRKEGRHRVDDETQDWFSRVSLKSLPFLRGGESNCLGFRPDAGPRTSDILDDIHYCESKARALGLEVLILDQSRRETGLTSVKVVVPGLHHYWRRLGQGRLYSVPVKLGWLPGQMLESELNSIAMLG